MEKIELTPGVGKNIDRILARLIEYDVDGTKFFRRLLYVQLPRENFHKKLRY